MKKTLANVYKVLSANMAYNWYESNGANPLWGTAGGGFYQLKNTQSAQGSTLTLPLHIWDLSAVPNRINGNFSYTVNGWAYTKATELSGAIGSMVPISQQNSILFRIV